MGTSFPQDLSGREVTSKSPRHFHRDAPTSEGVHGQRPANLVITIERTREDHGLATR